MAKHADGVIVGSAIVKLIGKYGEDAVPHVAEYVKSMKDAIVEL
jgi:tryptophan synthase alpha chain